MYEGKKGNYSEKDPVKPFNNYGLSKLGGEALNDLGGECLLVQR